MSAYVISFNAYAESGKPLGMSHIGIESNETSAKAFVKQVEDEALAQTKSRNADAHAVVITSIFKL